jgi:hypothetical protein
MGDAHTEANVSPTHLLLQTIRLQFQAGRHFCSTKPAWTGDLHLLHRSDFFCDVQLHVCLRLVLGNRSRDGLTAVDCTEHGFAGKLKSFGSGIARFFGGFRHWQRTPLPETQDSRRQDRGDCRGRFVAKRGFNCLPTGRRFELAWKRRRWETIGARLHAAACPSLETCQLVIAAIAISDVPRPSTEHRNLSVVANH